MSLESALIDNTAALRELIAALTEKTSSISTAPIVQAVVDAQKELVTKEAKTRVKAEKSPTPAQEEAPLLSEISGGEVPAIPEVTFTFSQVQQLITKLATPGAYENGRVKAVAVLQRHGLTKFTEEQVKGNQEIIDSVGVLITAVINGEVYPLESLS